MEITRCECCGKETYAGLAACPHCQAINYQEAGENGFIASTPLNSEDLSDDETIEDAISQDMRQAVPVGLGGAYAGVIGATIALAPTFLREGKLGRPDTSVILENHIPTELIEKPRLAVAAYASVQTIYLIFFVFVFYGLNFHDELRWLVTSFVSEIVCPKSDCRYFQHREANFTVVLAVCLALLNLPVSLHFISDRAYYCYLRGLNFRRTGRVPTFANCCLPFVCLPVTTVVCLLLTWSEVKSLYNPVLRKTPFDVSPGEQILLTLLVCIIFDLPAIYLAGRTFKKKYALLLQLKG